MTAMVHEDSPGVLVATPAGDVHVVIDGDPGAAIVVACVHGLPGGARDFRLLGRALAKRGACCVRLDLPGFGRSPAPSALLRRPQDRAALVAAVMKARGHRRYAVVGHSFGGTAALALAGMAGTSSSVTALGLICSVGITRHQGLTVPHEFTGAIAGLHGVPLVGSTLTGPFVRLFRQATERLGVRGDRAFTDDELVDHAHIIGGLDFKDLRAFAGAVQAPTLVLSAQDDRLVESAVSFTLAAALRRAPIVTHHHREQGGHFLQHRAPHVIADWLMAVASPA
jgi:pimeloyl-ACP methyl ester carboxylesterase